MAENSIFPPLQKGFFKQVSNDFTPLLLSMSKYWNLYLKMPPLYN